MADPGTASVRYYKDLQGTRGVAHGRGVAGADRLMVLRIRITTILGAYQRAPGTRAYSSLCRTTLWPSNDEWIRA